MFRKALVPLLIVLAVILLLAAAAYWYEQNWGLQGPFPSEHHH
jgi:hypothetical protein